MSRPRRIFVIVLVVAGSIALLAGSAAVWTRDTLLDRDEFVGTLGPVSQQPQVADALSAFLVGELSESLMLEGEIEGALPDAASFLAGPLTDQIETFAAQAASAVVASDQFNELWTAALGQSHDLAEGILEGDREVIDASDGQVVVDLSPVVAEVVDLLDERGVDVGDVPEDAGRFVLVSDDQMSEVQQTVDLLDALAWVLPFLALVLFVAALWLSGDRRRTLLGVGTGIAIAMALTLVVLALARTGLVDIVEPQNTQAAGTRSEERRVGKECRSRWSPYH